MMDLVLLLGIPAVLGTSYLIWKFWLAPGTAWQPGAPARRREDARDWQRRFGADSLLKENFLQPTQNEILETLYVLDHLTPGWEAGNAGSVEHRFLHELALNFPTLCKTKCTFPLPCNEIRAADGQQGSTVTTQQATEAEIAAKREAFRLGRAQVNALEQIVSSSDRPAEFTAGSLPFRPSETGLDRRARKLWAARLAVAMVVVVALAGTVHFLPGAFSHKFAQLPSTSSLPIPAPVTAEFTPTIPVVTEDAVIAAPTPSPVAIGTPEVTPAPPPPSVPVRESAGLGQQVAASKQRAISKYPALVVEGSEINLRFVFRYKNLVQQNSPRLLDPNWPEQLVEECAAASGQSSKRNAFTQVLGTPR